MKDFYYLIAVLILFFIVAAFFMPDQDGVAGMGWFTSFFSSKCRNTDQGCVNSSVKCCSGLTKAAMYTISGNSCKKISCGTVCIRCGDGICGPKENKCNCSRDCKSGNASSTSATSTGR